MTTVFVTGLEFHAFHGVLPEERRLGRRFRMDITAQVSESAWDSDDVEQTVDYAVIASTAFEAVTERSFSTVERAAWVAGERLLARFPRISEVSVRLAKLQPPIPLQIDAVGVEITLAQTFGKG